MKRDDLKLVANYQICVKHENNKKYYINVPFDNKKGLLRMTNIMILRIDEIIKHIQTCKIFLAKCKSFSTMEDWTQLS